MAPKTPLASPWLQALNLVSVVATVVFNVWVSRQPPNGVTQSEVSAAYPTLITPAGWAFAIWGAIYVALLCFALFQLRPSQRARPYLAQIGWLNAGAAAANASWLVAFPHTYGRPELAPLTLVPMYGLAAFLLAIYLRLGVGRRPVGVAEKLAVHVPFSLYLGWVTPAAMVNTAVVVKALRPGISLEMQRALAVVVLMAVHFWRVRKDGGLAQPL